jgi:hypothetical protein
MLQSLAILLVFASPSLAQINVRQVSVVEVSEKSEKIGGYVVVPKDFRAQPFNIAHAKWETKVPLDRLRIKLTDSKRQSVPFIDLKEEGIVVTQIGHFWLEVRGSYFDKTEQDIYEFDEQTEFFVDAISPTPAPEPQPDDPDPPQPTPDKIDNITVLIVYESGALPSYKQSHRSVIQSTDLRAWMSDNVAKDSNALPNWRVLDKDTKFPPNSDIIYRKWLSTAPPKLPYLIIGNKDVIVFQGELPENPEEIKTLITKYKR